MTSQTTEGFDPAAFDEFLSDKGNNALLGIRYHAHCADWIELAMPWDERFLADPHSGALANGAIMTLMDNAAGSAIYPKRGGTLPQVTIDLRADYLRPTRPGAMLIARGHCFGLSGSTALTRAFAYESSPDDPACHVTATFMLL